MSLPSVPLFRGRLFYGRLSSLDGLQQPVFVSRNDASPGAAWLSLCPPQQKGQLVSPDPGSGSVAAIMKVFAALLAFCFCFCGAAQTGEYATRRSSFTED